MLRTSFGFVFRRTLECFVRRSTASPVLYFSLGTWAHQKSKTLLPATLPQGRKEAGWAPFPPSHTLRRRGGGVEEGPGVQTLVSKDRLLLRGAQISKPRIARTTQAEPFPGLARGTARIPRKVRGDWHWLRPLETRGSARSTSRPRASLGNGEAERVAGELLAALAALSTVKPKVTRTDRPQGARGPPSPPARRRRSSPRADPAPAAGDWRALGGGAAPRLYKYS